MSEPTRSSSILEKLELQTLLASSFSHEKIRSEVQLMADNGKIRALKELDDGDQMKFLELIDQVRVRYLPRLRIANLDYRDFDPTNSDNHE